MSTVINFNILNFFRPDNDGSGSGTREGYAGPERKTVRHHRVIDVTPFSKVAGEREARAHAGVRMKHGPAVSQEAGVHIDPSTFGRTYDRRGNATAYLPKGLHVDSYA